MSSREAAQGKPKNSSRGSRIAAKPAAVPAPRPSLTPAWIALWAPRLFLLVGIPIGLFYVFGSAPMQVPDEGAHFIRAYGLSMGRCIGRNELPVPKALPDFKQHYAPYLERKGISTEELRGLVRGSMPDATDGIGVAVTGNLYSCVPYLPAAIGIRVGRLFDGSPGLDMYLGRLGNLIGYLGLTWVALALLPDFHILMLALALMPMTMHQAGSLSADSLSFAFAFLFAACVLRLAFSPDVERLSRRQFATLGLLVLLVAFGKFNGWLLTMVALIPAAKLGGWRNWSLAVAGYLAIGVAAILGWQAANVEATRTYAQAVLELGAHTDTNATLLREHPLEFLRSAGLSLSLWPYEFGEPFVGVFGYLSVRMPLWVYQAYLGMLLTVAATQTQVVSLPWPRRILLLLLAVTAAVTVFAAMAVMWTPTNTLQQALAGKGSIEGVQGRYFIPFAFPALLVFSNTITVRFVQSGRAALIAVTLCCTAANCIAAQTIVAAFYR